MVQQWRTHASPDPLEEDKPRWFKLAVPPAEYEYLAALPLEMAEKLYPDVAKFGPNGVIISKLFLDLEGKKDALMKLEAEQVDELLKSLDPLKEMDTAFDNLEESIEEELSLLIESMLQKMGVDDPDADFEDLIFAAAFMIIIDGFCDPEDTPDEIEQIRRKYFPLIHSILVAFDLNSDDYVTLDRS